MRRIVCEDCKRVYDCDKDDFCSRCGAFNQPVKTWTTDNQGNIRRVDGVNEANHAGSFVHSEVHREKRIRQAKGMDQKKSTRRQPAARPAAKLPSKRENDHMGLIKAIFIFIAVSMLISWIVPWIARSEERRVGKECKA